MKLQVVYGESKYTYNLSNDGEPCVYPLQSGDGQYTVRVLENVNDSKYMEVYNIQVDVKLESEFEPYLRPSQIVNYTEKSACVALAAQLAQEAQSEIEVVSAVYQYIVENIDYDYEKAQTVADGYLPTPDNTLASRTGICFDYAALAAAMLRSLGIPTQVITGYVQDGAVYHAWNRIYLQDGGWITVKIKAPTHSWQTVDLTFAANGVDEAPVTSDGNYVQRYVY
jgi:transglutaminase-like putative cysteine protease